MSEQNVRNNEVLRKNPHLDRKAIERIQEFSKRASHVGSKSKPSYGLEHPFNSKMFRSHASKW